VDKRRRIHQYRGLRWMRYRLSTLSSDYCLLTTWVAGVNPRWNNIDHVMLNTNRFRVNIVYTFSGIGKTGSGLTNAGNQPATQVVSR